MNANIPSGLDGTWKGTNDGGSCCNTQAETVKLTGYIGVVAALPTWVIATSAISPDPAATKSSYNASNVAYSCVANTSVTVNAAGTDLTAFGAVSWELDASPYTSWWCSNGLYKKVTGVTGGTTDGSANVS
jgi:hypothetical protein